ncbi:conserved hypothetical protein [Denitrovibrio acetiphilus DSM 12809]|uniref:Uncharacterized protein n=1 Tax=Denitrovibrio acetiphilus (strain DSM 12809 / NBRC 114555 / N2460) TaxID=522772 RepID=D4H1F1_DENA2|nr:hypothetical protein [Denitrovibrio acetiphilus]ADD66899.1 conserved hypothetical protein [Denitrovibrio acetiphilus DSM 12809]
MLRVSVLILLLCTPVSAFAENNFININIQNKLFEQSAVNITVGDIKNLLKESFKGKSVTINGDNAEINIYLRLQTNNDIPTARVFPSSILYPVQFYMWKSRPSKEGLTLTLSAPDAMGIVFGLYGLLQEKLGFRFYHPKNTFIPALTEWNLPSSFTFEGEPLFQKRGFHLHTMHPMELTEQLHSSMDGTGYYDVKEYIDWLVRNGQNVMQFWLLRTADRETWTQHASRYVRYAKQRGVLTGAVISLSTLQQKAFQTVNLLNPLESYEKQIDENVKWLLQVPFDYVSIDFTMGEYLPDLSELMPEHKKYLIKTIKEKYGVNVMENTHVIKRKPSESPDTAGVMIHSVMFYSLTEDEAPVYGNKNQQFMFEMMQKEKTRRETWYWPESSYWVTFDTSVPLFLLPYLKSRHDDITLMADQGIEGHVTFTSGWEWGYWVIDYSIARWSWQFRTDGEIHKTSPVSVLADVFADDAEALFNYAADVQEKYLKDEKLISLLSAKTPFEELPWPFNKTFQPKGNYSMLKASLPFVGKKHREMIKQEAQMLMDFSDDLFFIVNALHNNAQPTDPLRDSLRTEIMESLEITALRAKHRYYTLLAGAFRNYNLNDSSEYYFESLLANAAKTRKQAKSIVRSMELEYRYPVSLIARKMQSHTSYDFGYLYPVSDLYFWQREEQQVSRSRFDAFFMNIWNFWDTLGLDGLFK